MLVPQITGGAGPPPPAVTLQRTAQSSLNKYLNNDQPELSLQALGPLAGQRGRVGGRHVGGAARPRDVEGVEAEPDLTDLAGDLADREEAG